MPPVDTQKAVLLILQIYVRPGYRAGSHIDLKTCEEEDSETSTHLGR